MIRNLGVLFGAFVFILDALKGALSIFLAYIIHKVTNTSIGIEYLVTIAALFVIIRTYISSNVWI